MKQYYTGGQCQSCSCAIIHNPIIPAIYSVAGIFFSALWKKCIRRENKTSTILWIIEIRNECINRSMPTHSYRLRMSAWMYHYRCISHRLSRFMSQKTEYIRSKGQNCAKKRSISVHMHMGFVRLGRKRAENGAFPSTCVSISVYPSDIYVRETVHFRSPFQDFSARSISVHWPRLRTVPSSHEKRSISVHFSLVLPTFASKLKNNKMQSSHGR